MSRVQLLGGAYQARSVIASAQRCLNMIPEPIPQDQGEPSQFVYYPSPGLRPLFNFPHGPIRAIRQCPNGRTYVVAGSQVHWITRPWLTSRFLGSITAGITTPVSLSDNGLQLAIVDGSANGWTVDLATNDFAQISDASGLFRGADRVDYLDTFLLFNVPGTPQFIASNSLSVTFDPLMFANKEAFSDLLVSLAVVKREIYLIGQRTTEIWYNTGGGAALGGAVNTFPFEAMPNTFIDQGCSAKYSVATLDNSVFWLSQDRAGRGMVLRGAGYEARRVSTYAIEDELQRYETLSDAVGYCYQLGGHILYVLAFPTADKTWAYDTSTNLWHELAWIDTNGTEHRHRANCAWGVEGDIVVGDWQSNKLYALDRRTFTDDGMPIKRERAFPHLIADGRRVFYRQFIADFQAEITAPVPGQDFWNDGGVLAMNGPFNWPASLFGLTAGAVWNNGLSVAVVPGATPNPAAPPVFFGPITAAAFLILGGGNLPIADPHVVNQIWNNSGAACISAG